MAINAGKADEMERGGKGEIGPELELEEQGGGVDVYPQHIKVLKHFVYI